jgi:hypothetical protein
LALDIPPVRNDGDTWIAADYNKIRTSLLACAPRVIQPISAVGLDDYTLNQLRASQIIHLVGGTATNGSLYWSMIVPDDYVALETGVLRVWCSLSGNLRWASILYYGSPGEAADAHNTSLAYAVVAITANTVLELDISAVFADVPAGAQATLLFVRSGSHASDTLDGSFGVYPIPHLAYTP